MLRHLLILVRDHFSLPGTLTIALDRHLSRGEHIEIVPDRRRPLAEGSVAQWLTGRERRRPSAVDDQLQAQGYAIISREDDAPAPLPPPTPRPLERAPFARPEPAPFARPDPAPFARPDLARSARGGPVPAPRDEPRALRNRLYDDLDDLYDQDDVDERDDFLRPRGAGLFLAVLVVVAALAVGLVLFGTQARDRLAGALTPAAPPPATAPPATPPTAATPATPAAEEPAPAPAASGTADRTAPAPAPALPAPAAPTAEPPSLPAPAASRQARATTEERTPVAKAAPDSPALALPPRRTEPAAPERSSEPAPQAVRSQRLPDFPGLPRVEVSRAPSPEGTTFTVRLTDTRGRPLPDAQVWLRQTSRDGSVRETPLELVAPGSYRAAVPVTAGRPEALTVRIDLGDRRVEMPVGE